MQQLFTRRLVTIITESALERALVEEIESLGARGFTITEARGKGSRGVRQYEWPQGANIRIEIICDADLADRIAGHVRARFYDNYAMVLFMQDVTVLRPDKF